MSFEKYYKTMCHTIFVKMKRESIKRVKWKTYRLIFFYIFLECASLGKFLCHTQDSKNSMKKKIGMWGRKKMKISECDSFLIYQENESQCWGNEMWVPSWVFFINCLRERKTRKKTFLLFCCWAFLWCLKAGSQDVIILDSARWHQQQLLHRAHVLPILMIIYLSNEILLLFCFLFSLSFFTSNLTSSSLCSE